MTERQLTDHRAWPLFKTVSSFIGNLVGPEGYRGKSIEEIEAALSMISYTIDLESGEPEAAIGHGGRNYKPFTSDPEFIVGKEAVKKLVDISHQGGISEILAIISELSEIHTRIKDRGNLPTSDEPNLDYRTIFEQAFIPKIL